MQPNNTPQQTTNPSQPEGNTIDYAKPVAYDQQGNPLYAHPPVQAEQQSPQRQANIPTREELGGTSSMTQPWLEGQEGAEKSLHYLEAEKRLSTEGRHVFKYIEFDEQEDLVTEVRKHWFGLFLLWLVGLSATLVITVVPLMLSGNLSLFSTTTTQDTTGLAPALIAVGLLLGVLGLFVTFLLAIMYTKNVIFVTTDKIAQVKYTGLIHRKISQLGVGDVQDVTVSQNTIPSRIFNYGTLVIETAGEQNNYTFSYVPSPYKESKAIIWAREENVKLHGN